MAVSIADIQKIRKMTGAGLADCKKALTDAEGDFDKAVQIIREKGQAIAAKRSDRETSNGCVLVKADNGFSAMIALKCETDFVANGKDFIALTQSILDAAVAAKAKTLDEVKALPLNGSTVQDEVIARSGITGEKTELDGYLYLEGDNVSVYDHMNKHLLCTIVQTNKPAEEQAHAVAMQVAAMNPTYISRNDISAEELAKLQEITVDAALNDPASLPKPILNKLIDKAMNSSAWSDEDKAIYEEKKSNMNYLFNFLSKEAAAALAELAMADKDAIVSDKIFKGLADGRVSKQLKEICLLDQTYVKAEDGKQTVAKYLESVNKALTIAKVVRFEVGEGMEKKNEDFAAEVAAQMNA